MAKRPAEDTTDGGVSLKSGERPQKVENSVGEANIEGEFEDDYESDEEIIEAGVNGRPDEEREIEEKGTWTMLEARCECAVSLPWVFANWQKMQWILISEPSYLDETNCKKERHYHRIAPPMRCYMPLALPGHVSRST